ncbi:RNA 2',3'-cyclic phosphodiesterase [Oceanobacillus sp. J11TS1]|uniref:RNA 2',3'-cyclic phosphodiesterase n=1 Tax=Oceanobacillus sp. J11TS1 TaxID=2807191 RepID=UPI001B163167|nr:RNA 2',3'-cyclic phosphodiesterase [Oceanobacillus sp. J11TS1]GIO24993.1 RNA 2',3'-cyclic phosphodiesterase [Oceanobacillus sp. J11TS1]
MSHYFIGIQIGSILAKQLSDWKVGLEKCLPYKQWTDKSDFHITLAFLGEVDEKSIELLKNKLQSISAYPAFEIERTSIGTFGQRQRPRVLWLGAEKNSILLQVQEEVTQISESIGYKKESRPYTPHITIAKKWASDDKMLTEDIWKEILYNMPALDDKIKVDAIQLFKVHPTSKPKYEIVQSFPLH